MRRSRLLPPALLLALVSINLPTAHASRTGLNNIPIADVSPAGTGVMQAYTAFGTGRQSSLLSGVRTGGEAFGERFELGLDSRWEPRPSVPLFFNFKWVSHWRKPAPALGLGMANVAPRREDRGPLGQPQSYAVLSHDASFARLHAGYAVQLHNTATFLGVDRSWMIGRCKLTFRADAIEIQNRRQWLCSAGLTCKFTPALTLEIWESQPTRSGHAFSTVKLGWQFATRHHPSGRHQNF